LKLAFEEFNSDRFGAEFEPHCFTVFFGTGGGSVEA